MRLGREGIGNGTQEAQEAQEESQSNCFLCFLCSVSLLFLAGCGKVGDPLPPFIRIPNAVKDLGATQNGHNIVLTWTNPPRNIDGSAATNLAHVQIRMNDSPVTTVNINAAGRTQSYVIPLVQAAGGPRTFTVLVDTTLGKVSRISNAVSIIPVEVPGEVTRLSATVDQRRITLVWDKPLDHPELADAYVVTRTDTPAESETVSDTRYEDSSYPTEKVLTYQVTPVRRLPDRTVTGVGPKAVTVSTQDKTPPQVPTGLDIAQSDTAAFVTWNANTEADLAGYRLFRSGRSDSDFKPVSERLIPTNGFYDQPYRPELYYAVSAVDEFGNESAMSAPFRAK